MPVPQSVPLPRFQPPPHRTQHADFPHNAPLLASYQGLWDLSDWERFPPRLATTDPVVTEESEAAIQPPPTPPLPAEAWALPGTHQMTLHLLLHPIAHIAETAARRANGKVIDPPAQDWIDRLNHLPDGLGSMAPEDLFHPLQ